MDPLSRILGVLAGGGGICRPPGANVWRLFLDQRPHRLMTEVETLGEIQGDFVGSFRGNSHVEGCSLSYHSVIRSSLGRAPVGDAPPCSSSMVQ